TGTRSPHLVLFAARSRLRYVGVTYGLPRQPASLLLHASIRIGLHGVDIDLEHPGVGALGVIARDHAVQLRYVGTALGLQMEAQRLAAVVEAAETVDFRGIRCVNIGARAFDELVEAIEFLLERIGLGHFGAQPLDFGLGTDALPGLFGTEQAPDV